MTALAGSSQCWNTKERKTYTNLCKDQETQWHISSPEGRVLKKLRVMQPVNQFCSFYCIKEFITMLTTSNHMSPNNILLPVPLISVLTFSSCLCLRYPNWFLPFTYSNQKCICISHPSQANNTFFHWFLHDFNTQITADEEGKSRSFPLGNLLHPPVTSSLLHPIFSKLCSLELSNCYSLRVSNHAPYPYPLSCLVNIAQTKVVFLHEIQLLTHILQQLLALVMTLKHTQRDELLKLQPNHHLQSLAQHGLWSCTVNKYSNGTPVVTQ